MRIGAFSNDFLTVNLSMLMKCLLWLKINNNKNINFGDNSSYDLGDILGTISGRDNFWDNFEDSWGLTFEDHF